MVFWELNDDPGNESDFADKHDMILSHLRKQAQLKENTPVVTAVLMSVQLPSKERLHLVLLAEGVIPAVWHYQNSFTGPIYWWISTLHSKRKLKLNEIWLDSSSSGKTTSHNHAVPQHVVMTVSSVKEMGKHDIRTEFSTRVIQPDVASDDLMSYIQGKVGIEIDAQKMQIEFKIYDGETKLDSVAGSFSRIKVSLNVFRSVFSIVVM